MDYSVNNFSKIPYEIIGYIFSYVGETKNIRQVCRFWNQLSMDLVRNFVKDVQALNPERFETITILYPKIKEESDYFYTTKIIKEIIKDQNTLLPDPMKWKKISSFHPGLIFQQLKENEAFIESQTLCTFGEAIQKSHPGKFDVYHDDGDIFAKANWFREQIKKHALDFTELYLQYCGIKRLPDELANFANLTKLNLNENQLTSLPYSIGRLTSLTALGLNENQFTSLPYSIGRLTSLTALGLNGNQLTSLPNSIGDLTSLTRLGLSRNELTCLPDGIGRLTSLTKLWLYGNQFESLPKCVSILKSNGCRVF